MHSSQDSSTQLVGRDWHAVCASLRRLAHLVGCYRSLISNYETGRCRTTLEEKTKTDRVLLVSQSSLFTRNSARVLARENQGISKTLPIGSCQCRNIILWGQIKETMTWFRQTTSLKNSVGDRRKELSGKEKRTGVKVRSSPIPAARRTTPTSVGIPNQDNITIETIKKGISTRNLASEYPG